MAIFVDSADINDIEKSMNLGFLSGVTTNPLLMAKQGPAWENYAFQVLEKISGSLYYQIDIVSEDLDVLKKRALYLHKKGDGRLLLKLPATSLYFKLLSQIVDEIPCCMTAVYSMAQCILAAQLNAHSIAIYVNRMNHYKKKMRIELDGCQLIENARRYIDKNKSSTRILAASLKTSNQVASVFESGTHDITAGFDVLSSLLDNELSLQANADFINAIKSSQQGV